MPRPKSPPVLRDRILDLRRIPARDLQDHQHNWRTHPQAQREALQGVLSDLGIASALLVYDSPRQGGLCVIDGHLRKSLDPAQEWPCLLLDLDDDEATYLLATHDPLGAMAEASREALAQVLETVQSGQASVQQLLAQLAEQHGVIPSTLGPESVEDVEPEIDRAEELRQQYGVEVGQLWACGEHRVVCGDCTDKAVVERVMQGAQVDLVLTSPPYAVGKEYEQGVTFAEHLAMLRGFADRCLEITKPGGFVFTNFGEIAAQSHAGPLTGSDRQCLYLISKDYWQIFHEERRCDLYAQRIWYKPFNRLQQPFWTYHTSIPHYQEWEHIWTWRVPGGDGDTVYDWDISCRAVWDTRAESTDDKPLTRHTAAFPVGIPERALRAHTAVGALVYDPFLGSGTTLIVCDQRGRACRGIEIDPGYVAVTLHRWATLTGETPTLVDG